LKKQNEGNAKVSYLKNPKNFETLKHIKLRNERTVFYLPEKTKTTILTISKE